jgi:hypothetical protein
VTGTRPARRYPIIKKLVRTVGEVPARETEFATQMDARWFPARRGRTLASKGRVYVTDEQISATRFALRNTAE